MADTSLTESSEGKTMQAREEMRSAERYLKPAVNIVETEEGLMLTADVPGATKEGLEVHVEKGILTISARISHTLPGTAVYREFELATYYRQFAIPETLDNTKARAELINGILTLRIPKMEAAKPRRIEIQVS
ncbi:Hsp20/alpha crystallin family protein [Geomonas sp. RF6]|uniref:Hsp20/alpha crystallin family protein n=1 Tax=Geomonas sp. RF6 TaxID=2897342 RepID=UPI001E2FFC4E|nr:Hsp20/alpha crystallin family protein [Geomonas sp. RF6]UFS72522.1 Hsp20/alpha crystallin family protein [Geomonas sp. RF6]